MTANRSPCLQAGGNAHYKEDRLNNRPSNIERMLGGYKKVDSCITKFFFSFSLPLAYTHSESQLIRKRRTRKRRMPRSRLPTLSTFTGLRRTTNTNTHQPARR